MSIIYCPLPSELVAIYAQAVQKSATIRPVNLAQLREVTLAESHAI